MFLSYVFQSTLINSWSVTFLSNPHELHDLQKDYPLVPESLQIEENILSDYQYHLLQDG